MVEKQLRLGHVKGEDAKRLRETMNVEGISVEDMTRRVVKSYLDQKEAQERDGQMIKIVSDKKIPLQHVEGLGMCLICPDGPVTLEKFVSMIREAMKKS